MTDLSGHTWDEAAVRPAVYRVVKTDGRGGAWVVLSTDDYEKAKRTQTEAISSGQFGAWIDQRGWVRATEVAWFPARVVRGSAT